MIQSTYIVCYSSTKCFVKHLLKLPVSPPLLVEARGDFPDRMVLTAWRLPVLAASKSSWSLPMFMIKNPLRSYIHLFACRIGTWYRPLAHENVNFLFSRRQRHLFMGSTQVHRYVRSASTIGQIFDEAANQISSSCRPCPVTMLVTYSF